MLLLTDGSTAKTHVVNSASAPMRPEGNTPTHFAPPVNLHSPTWAQNTHKATFNNHLYECNAEAVLSLLEQTQTLSSTLSRAGTVLRQSEEKDLAARANQYLTRLVDSEGALIFSNVLEEQLYGGTSKHKPEAAFYSWTNCCYNWNWAWRALLGNTLETDPRSPTRLFQSSPGTIVML